MNFFKGTEAFSIKSTELILFSKYGCKATSFIDLPTGAIANIVRQSAKVIITDEDGVSGMPNPIRTEDSTIKILVNAVADINKIGTKASNVINTTMRI